MINAIYCPIGAILGVIRRRRVRRRGSMHSGCHDVVQFGLQLTRMEDGGGCTRIAPCLQDRCSAVDPQTWTRKDVQDIDTYLVFIGTWQRMGQYAAIQIRLSVDVSTATKRGFRVQCCHYLSSALK